MCILPGRSSVALTRFKKGSVTQKGLKTPTLDDYKLSPIGAILQMFNKILTRTNSFNAGTLLFQEAYIPDLHIGQVLKFLPSFRRRRWRGSAGFGLGNATKSHSSSRYLTLWYISKE